MQLRLARIFTSGVSLAAGLLLAAAAVQAADPVTGETESAKPVAEEQPQVPSLPPVLLHRGSVTETVSFAATAEADTQEVVVSRGATEPDAPTVRDPAAEPQARIWSSSGRDLWFYDPEDESLRACRLFKGQYVGRWKIRCFERRL